jgi:hypothetical protein
VKRLFKGEAYRLTGYGIPAADVASLYTQAVLKFLKLR